jgi:flagellar basal body-associated protein FliL
LSLRQEPVTIMKYMADKISTPDASSQPKGPKGEGSKKQKKKADGPSAMSRLARKIGGISAEIREIRQGLRSPDQPTRRMSIFFFLSLVGMAIVVGVAAKRFYDLKHEQFMAQERAMEAKMGEFFAKQAEEAKRKGTTQSLGQFILELKPIPNQRQVPGVVNMAEVELVAQCDERDTCTYIEENIARVRNEVTNIFVAFDRDELLSREGKKRIKKSLLDKLNLWLPKGKIEEIYFSRLVIS